MLSLSTKRVTSLTVIITDLFLSYIVSAKPMIKVYTLVYQEVCAKWISYSFVNLSSKINTLVWQLVHYEKNITTCYTKFINMTSVEAILVTLVSTLLLPVAMTLEAAIQNNLSKSRKHSREICVVEFRYSETIVLGIHNNFTHDSQAYDIVKL